MNINIETNTVQNTSSEELDLIAKELCGVKLSLADSGIPAYLIQSVSEEGVVASTIDGVHADTRDALSGIGITVLSLNTYLRILDPEVKRVLIETVGLGSLGNITTEEFGYLTRQRLGNAFKNNSLITNFDEIKYTAITELTDNEFYGCSNLKSLDLSNITKVGYRVFQSCKVFDFGDISNLIAVSNDAISLSLHEKYKNLTLPNLDRTYTTGKFANYYNDYFVPKSTEFFYAPNCTSTGMRPTGINLKYAYFPKVQDFGAKLVTVYDSKNYASKNNVLNILSIGEDVLYVRGTIATYTTNPNACMVIHANSFELLDGLNTWGDLDNDKANGALYKNTFVVDYNAIPTRFKKIDTRVCEIGYEDWKQRMQMFSEDREYTIPDQYTDFYYDYIDYMLGGIPLPDSLMSNPSIIEIHAERIGKLNDNDEICQCGNSINLKVHVNSYKNASTLELIENNAGVTLNGRVLTIPSTANGETVTLRATNIYNPSLTTQVTVKIYDYRYKYIAVEPLVYDRLSWASSDGQGLTMQDLLGITDFPPSLFYNSDVSNFDTFQYTSVQSIPYAYCWKAGTSAGLFQGSTLLSICFPQTLTTLETNSFRGVSTLTSAVIPNGVTSIGDSAFEGCSNLSSVTLPNAITSIGSRCFVGCRNLITSVPTSVTALGNNAFYQCDMSGIAVDLPNILTIGNRAFYQTKIVSVIIGISITEIEKEAFYGCSTLSSVTINATTPPTLENSNAFDGTNNCPIYVPAGSVSTYQSAPNWSTHASRIQATPTT